MTSPSDKRSIAAIVPAYNEEETIAQVVRVLIHSGFFSEVIVVSDGSTDRTATRAREEGADVVELSRNQGKSTAMREGVKRVKAPIILFSDADLIGLRSEHLRALITPVQTGRAGMCVGVRDRGLIGTWLARHLPLIGGERCLRREIFERIPTSHMQGYRGELLLNARCRTMGFRITTVRLKGLHIRRKIDKVGFWKGLHGYLKMSAQLVHAFWLILLS